MKISVVRVDTAAHSRVYEQFSICRLSWNPLGSCKETVFVYNGTNIKDSESSRIFVLLK